MAATDPGDTSALKWNARSDTESARQKRLSALENAA
jgi:hypothetical protein